MATDPSGRGVEQHSRFDQSSPFEALAWTDVPVKDGPVGPRHGLLGTRFAGVAATGGVLLAAGVAIGTVAVVAAAMLIGTGPTASTDPLNPVASGRRLPARQPAQGSGGVPSGAAPAAPAGAVLPAPSVPPKLTGSFTVWSAGPQRNPCVDHPQVPDIKAGAPVVVSDAAGKVLATTRLAQGRPEATKRGCVFAFSLAGLPSADSFAVKVGRQSILTFPTAALANNGWRVTLNLGLPDRPAKNTG